MHGQALSVIAERSPLPCSGGKDLPHQKERRKKPHTAEPHFITKDLAKKLRVPAAVTELLALPVERTLFDGVNETHHQNHHEPQHAAKNGPWVEFVHIVPVDHSPRVHEHNLDIE
jgi:hypothetical protein